MKRILLVLLILLPAFGCGHKGDGLQNGDLIFVGLPMDYDAETGSIDEAISSATGDGALNLIHVAIAEVKADSVWVIDATIAHGVDRHPLDTFFKDFTLPQDLPGTNPQNMSVSQCLVDVPASI